MKKINQINSGLFHVSYMAGNHSKLSIAYFKLFLLIVPQHF